MCQYFHPNLEFSLLQTKKPSLVFVLLYAFYVVILEKIFNEMFNFWASKSVIYNVSTLNVRRQIVEKTDLDVSNAVRCRKLHYE